MARVNRLGILAALAASVALSGCAAPPPHLAPGGPRVGVVVLHGKWDNPYGHTLKFTRMMQAVGFLTDSPEMTWSTRRSYDAGVEGMVSEIGEAVERLRSRGAQKIFIAGESLGAAGAMRYAALHRVDGLVALSPGHFPEGQRFAELVAGSLAKARAMRPGETATFDDPNNGGRMRQLPMKAGTYLGFFDADGPMNFRRNCASIRPGTPVLWVVGRGEEEGLKRMGELAFRALPADPPAERVEVAGGHLDTAAEAAALCALWIDRVARR
jgi:pimeloyl-ACP methyl ester carboxylesterase